MWSVIRTEYELVYKYVRDNDGGSWCHFRNGNKEDEIVRGFKIRSSATEFMRKSLEDDINNVKWKSLRDIQNRCGYDEDEGEAVVMDYENLTEAAYEVVDEDEFNVVEKFSILNQVKGE